MSGGDYDGDKAWVCWDHTLLPRPPHVRTFPPAEYTLEPAPPHARCVPVGWTGWHAPWGCDSDRRGNDGSSGVGAVVNDAAAASSTDRMVGVMRAHHMMQRRLGAWSNFHMQLADRLGALHPRCIRAAEACSRAVDAPKAKWALGFPERLPWRKPAWWQSENGKGDGDGCSYSVVGALYDDAQFDICGRFAALPGVAAPTVACRRLPALERVARSMPEWRRWENEAARALQRYELEHARASKLADIALQRQAHAEKVAHCRDSILAHTPEERDSVACAYYMVASGKGKLQPSQRVGNEFAFDAAEDILIRLAATMASVQG